MDLTTLTLRCDGFCGDEQPVSTMTLLIAQKDGDVRPKTTVKAVCHMCLSKAHLVLALGEASAFKVA